MSLLSTELSRSSNSLLVFLFLLSSDLGEGLLSFLVILLGYDGSTACYWSGWEGC